MGRVPAPPRAGGVETGEEAEAGGGAEAGAGAETGGEAETGGRGKVQSEKLPGKNRTIKLQPM
jgi:hypothetical protein